MWCTRFARTTLDPPCTRCLLENMNPSILNQLCGTQSSLMPALAAQSRSSLQLAGSFATQVLQAFISLCKLDYQSAAVQVHACDSLSCSLGFLLGEELHKSKSSACTEVLCLLMTQI